MTNPKVGTPYCYSPDGFDISCLAFLPIGICAMLQVHHPSDWQEKNPKIKSKVTRLTIFPAVSGTRSWSCLAQRLRHPSIFSQLSISTFSFPKVELSTFCGPICVGVWNLYIGSGSLGHVGNVSIDLFHGFFPMNTIKCSNFNFGCYFGSSIRPINTMDGNGNTIWIRSWSVPWKYSCGNGIKSVVWCDKFLSSQKIPFLCYTTPARDKKSNHLLAKKLTTCLAKLTNGGFGSPLIQNRCFS